MSLGLFPLGVVLWIWYCTVVNVATIAIVVLGLGLSWSCPGTCKRLFGSCAAPVQIAEGLGHQRGQHRTWRERSCVFPSPGDLIHRRTLSAAFGAWTSKRFQAPFRRASSFFRLFIICFLFAGLSLATDLVVRSCLLVCLVVWLIAGGLIAIDC